jgi:hypothetical protein
MPLITFPDDAANWPGVYDIRKYRGSSADALELGVERARLLDDDNRLVHRIGGVEIQIGQPFAVRQHLFNPETDAFDGTPYAPKLIPMDVYRRGAVVAPQVDRANVSPGSPMRDRFGYPIFVDEDGDGVTEGRPNQPDSLDQSRDPWTGQPLFDEQGNPVLEP